MGKSTIINHVETTHKAVAITFDDGPNPVYTPQVLDIFEEVNGKATFYMIGKHMKEHPEMVKTVTANMHEIGNHTYSHPMLTELTPSDCLHEIEHTHQIIKEMTGKNPTTFRPPYLAYNDETANVIESLGYSTIGALNLDALDWEQPGVDHIFSKSRNHSTNGSILLFHDGFGDRSQTIAAVRKLVNELTDEGYQLVTVSELLNMSNK